MPIFYCEPALSNDSLVTNKKYLALIMIVIHWRGFLCLKIIKKVLYSSVWQ